jgi:hypothetical protein
LTVIDYILRETNVEMRARIFKILQNQPNLNNNTNQLREIFPEILTSSPYSLSSYLDARLINVPWTPNFTNGRLKQIEGDKIAIGMMNLLPLN